eukprot:Skav221257  [mRNA]  locus=scaffold1045:761216:761752:+ [translate_table: standard]
MVHLPSRFLPPRTQGPGAVVAAGPRPTKGSGKGKQDMVELQGDPWAAYRGVGTMSGPALPAPAAAATARATSGPIENKFQQQDERLKALETTMSKLAHVQEELKNETAQGFQRMEQRDNSTREMVNTTLAQFKTDMEKSVAHVMGQQTQSFNSNIADLKKMMQSITKRSKRDEDMSDS